MQCVNVSHETKHSYKTLHSPLLQVGVFRKGHVVFCSNFDLFETIQSIVQFACKRNKEQLGLLQFVRNITVTYSSSIPPPGAAN